MLLASQRPLISSVANGKDAKRPRTVAPRIARKPGSFVLNATRIKLGETSNLKSYIARAAQLTKSLLRIEDEEKQRLDGTIKLDKPRVVVLGSGWASMSFIKALPADIKDKYDVVVVSPRNYFLYTPLLPAVAAGTVEEASICEPVRTLVNGKGTYYGAVCQSIDPAKKELLAYFPVAEGQTPEAFTIKYDMLIVGVGCASNTFGVAGVEKYCHMFKTVEDAHNFRVHVSDCFERAALPNTSDEERQRLLSFVIVGGGPTGVEVAAELHDMVFEDLKGLYPEVIPHVTIRLIELTDHLMSAYDPKVSELTQKQLQRSGIDLVLRTRVAAVHDGSITVAHADGSTEQIPFGAAVWATGIAINPLVKQLQQLFPEQTHPRCVLTDDHMRVKGSDGSIWAVGDAATIHHPKAVELAEELFEKADTDKDGCVSLRELQQLLHDAVKDNSCLEEHEHCLNAQTNSFDAMVSSLLSSLSHNDSNGSNGGNGADRPKRLLQRQAKLSKEEFVAALQHVDGNLKALPATAQVAKQQGEYIADLLASGHYSPIEGKLHSGMQKELWAEFLWL